MEKSGYKVWAPQLPKPEAPNLNLQLPFVLRNGNYNDKTIIICHSAACPLTLSILENINVKIKKAILVAGYARPLQTDLKGESEQLEKDAMPILQKKYDWKKIRKNVEEIYFINSDNDPWGCDDKEGRYMFDHLGGTLIIKHGEGHMGSNDFGQPYKEFLLFEKLISERLWG